jgi:hypothetical protein
MTDTEAIELAVRALSIYAARHPRPAHVTVTQAAQMLGLSRFTTRKYLLENRIRLNAAGRIPIEAVDRLLASRTDSGARLAGRF